MLYSIANGSGAANFARLLRSVNAEKYDECREAYYAAALCMGVTPGRFPSFEEAGAIRMPVPSEQWCGRMVKDLTAERRPELDQAISLLPGTTIAADASFKVRRIKSRKLRRAETDHVHLCPQIIKKSQDALLASCWTGVNEIGQIRVQVLAPSKHNAHCTAALINLQKSLAMHGHPRVALFTVDNPKADAAWLQSIIPSLLTHVTPIGPPVTSGLPPAKLPEKLGVFVMKNFDDIEHLCKLRLRAIEQSQQEVHCGLDTEHKPGYNLEGRDKTALIQLAFDDEIYLFQVRRRDALF